MVHLPRSWKKKYNKIIQMERIYGMQSIAQTGFNAKVIMMVLINNIRSWENNFFRYADINKKWPINRKIYLIIIALAIGLFNNAFCQTDDYNIESLDGLLLSCI